MVAVKIFKKSAKRSAAALCHRSEKKDLLIAWKIVTQFESITLLNIQHATSGEWQMRQLPQSPLLMTIIRLIYLLPVILNQITVQLTYKCGKSGSPQPKFRRSTGSQKIHGRVKESTRALYTRMLEPIHRHVDEQQETETCGRIEPVRHRYVNLHQETLCSFKLTFVL
jgi:hypothetical protein